jgi:hypothetical protein
VGTGEMTVSLSVVLRVSYFFQAGNATEGDRQETLEIPAWSVRHPVGTPADIFSDDFEVSLDGLKQAAVDLLKARAEKGGFAPFEIWNLRLSLVDPNLEFRVKARTKCSRILCSHSKEKSVQGHGTFLELAGALGVVVIEPRTIVFDVPVMSGEPIPTNKGGKRD